MLLLSAKHVAEEVDHPVTVAIFVVVPGEARREASVCECVCVHAQARPLTNLPPLSSGVFPLYQATSFTKLSLRAIPALASKMEEWESPLKSVETTCVTISKINVVQKPRLPLSDHIVNHSAGILDRDFLCW